MNTAAIEKFAASARRQLMEDVEQRLYELGLSREIMKLGAIPDVTRVTLDGKLLDFEQTNQWKELLERLSTIGYDRVVEQVAYTWFNRFVALRFMEVNGYLPSGVRVLSAADADPSDFRARPDIMRHATSALKVDEQLVREMRMAGDDERLYRYLLMAQCTELASTLPFLFEEIEGWIELLFPRNILAEGSIIRRLVAEILEEDWQEQVEIVGWLYQYYISERKNEVYAGFKKNKKASKHDIPPATQLFTPNWIVRYMVDNSLGRLWLESRPESTLRPLMDYYIDEAEQDPKVRAQLEKLIQSHIDPARITVIDPACGSGHILVYAFDLLYEMYVEAGYYIPDIPCMLLEHNLYGLDIDERAAQLAAFALMMKARERDPQIFSRGIRPNILAIRESNSISKELQSAILKATNEEERRQRAKELEYLMEVFHDASEYGSLIRVEQVDLSWLPGAVAKVRDTAKKQANAVLISDMESLTLSDLDRQGDLVLELVRQAEIMARKYDVVVTNPPYMGARNMGARLKDYLGNQYSRVKTDLFSAFIIRCREMSRPAGHLGFMCPFVWMFISSYEWMRRKLCTHSQITTLIQLEYSGFDGATVPICTFTLRSSTVSDRGVYIRLSEFRGSENQGPMALKAIKDPTVNYRYITNA
ncbi:MAG: BREX-1 system adenine-specific DNA-methyltransferase PglX, partial [Firmicutes bacterium]|nr:BREX-1 system adenine-specific DNA-methyltransferase PglX [Bacillota bacterium]